MTRRPWEIWYGPAADGTRIRRTKFYEIDCETGGCVIDSTPNVREADRIARVHLKTHQSKSTA